MADSVHANAHADVIRKVPGQVPDINMAMCVVFVQEPLRTRPLLASALDFILGFEINPCGFPPLLTCV